MNANLKKLKLTPVLFAGAAAVGIMAAPIAMADPPPPPPCFNPDGTPCAPSTGPQGAGAEVPGGPGAQAGSNGQVSAGVPGGPWAEAGPGGGVACVPGGPCRTIPLPTG
jgi:hypothetical protein